MISKEEQSEYAQKKRVPGTKNELPEFGFEGCYFIPHRGLHPSNISCDIP